MNHERYDAMIKEILFDPSRHNQRTWTNLDNRHLMDWDDIKKEYVPAKVKLEEGQLINCGTTACLAGLTAFRYAPKGTLFWGADLKLPNSDAHEYLEYSEYAKELLDLTYEEEKYIFDEDRTVAELVEFGELSDEDRLELADRWLNG